jgi:hypothetical protein
MHRQTTVERKCALSLQCSGDRHRPQFAKFFGVERAQRAAQRQRPVENWTEPGGPEHSDLAYCEEAPVAAETPLPHYAVEVPVRRPTD